jgi:hypothetical protein
MKTKQPTTLEAIVEFNEAVSKLSKELDRILADRKKR